MSREALRKLRLASRILIGFGVLVTIPLGMELFGGYGYHPLYDMGCFVGDWDHGR